MSEQFLKPKPIAYTSKKSFIKNKKILFSAVFLLIFSLMVWLIIKRFSRDPLEKVEGLIHSKNLRKAARLNYDLMTKHPEHRLAFLMNGTIINFGLREMNISDTSLPFYEYEEFLSREDRTGVFIRQSFLRKYTLFPDSVYFLDEFCRFYTDYPESIRNPETLMAIQRAIHSQTHWTNVSESCMEIIFNPSANLNEFFGVVTGDNLSVREKPDTRSRVMGKLKKEEIVLVKLEAMEDTIGEKKGKWLYVLTRNSVYGWVFGAYVDR